MQFLAHASTHGCATTMLSIALSALMGVLHPAPARAQDATPTEPAPTTQGNAQEEVKLRKRLIDAAAEATEWTPEFHADPELERQELLAQAERAYNAGRVVEGENSALDIYLRLLRINPGDAAAKAGINRVVAWAVQRGEAAIAAGRFEEGARLSAIASRQRADDPAVKALAAKIAAGRELAQLLASAQQRLSSGQWVEPAGASAVDAFRQVLTRDPGNASATAGLAQIQSLLAEQAMRAAQENDFLRADVLLGQADKVVPGSKILQDTGARITDLRNARAAALEQQVSAAIDGKQFDQAETLLGELDAVSLQPRQVESLREQLFNARAYASMKPGQRFTDPMADGGSGPEMVVIPLGSFKMGSPKREKGRADNEGPQIEVKFKKAFALGANEVTVGEFRRFVKASGYVPTSDQTRRSTFYNEETGGLSERAGVTWETDHSGRRANDNLPVIHVSWNDAQAYAQWLSQQTGKRYRLPSEAEFEYALRAGSDTPYPWGDGTPSKPVANITGDGDRSASRRTWVNAFKGYDDGYWGPAPVRSFEPNRFGLYDMVGNVAEWVEDCWHDSYQRAPTDGSAWVNQGCGLRMLRGGSWASAPDQVRSAFRLGASPGTVDARLGFRLARDL